MKKLPIIITVLVILFTSPNLVGQYVKDYRINKTTVKPSFSLTYKKVNSYQPLLIGMDLLYKPILENKLGANLLGSKIPRNKGYLNVLGRTYYYENPSSLFLVKNWWLIFQVFRNN